MYIIVYWDSGIILYCFFTAALLAQVVVPWPALGPGALSEAATTEISNTSAGKFS